MKRIVLIRVDEIRHQIRALKKVARAERPKMKDRRQLGLCDGIIAACDRLNQKLPKS